jgi:glycosyltransferase involved in cell wall biosynthesis
MKILFLAKYLSSFIERDLRILQSEHEVQNVRPTSIFQMDLITGLISNDLLFCWFASLSFFLPIVIAKLLRKKVLIVAGGYDVAKLKELNYGSMVSVWRGLVVRLNLKFADKIIAVSNSNMDEIIRNCKISKGKIEIIYHGFDIEKIPNSFEKQDRLVTVGLLNDATFFRKGFDRFIKLANELPGYEFSIIGDFNPEFIKKINIPQNVSLTGFVSKERLFQLLKTSKIYVQLSRHEGFGASVAEAMLSGCIPVVSNAYSLPEVVNDCGIIIEDPDNIKRYVILIQDLIQQYNSQMSLKCFERIKNTFPFELRRNKILNMIQDL